MIKHISKHAPWSVLTSTLLLAACSMAPSYERPQELRPEQWSYHSTASAAPTAETTADPDAQRPTGSGSLLNTTVAAPDWQDLVKDPYLRELVYLALTNNRDLRQALLNVEAARAQYQIKRADRLPNLAAQGSGIRQRLPADLSGTGTSAIQETYQAGIGLTAFEVDLFGRVSSLSQAALQQYLATEQATRGVKISLIAEVIQAYVTRHGAQRRHALTQQTLASMQLSLALTQKRHQAGTATLLDFFEAQELVEQAKVSLERVDRQQRQASNALALLVGVHDLTPLLPYVPVSEAASESVLVQEIALGVPSDLLLLRPDILAAEHQLRASNANIGAARAAFFPRISLTGAFGSASADLSSLFNSGQRAWSFAPQITLPIFDGGRNRANLSLAKLRKDQAVASYEKSIQVAFSEVLDALAATDTLGREETAQRRLTKNSEAALRIAEARYLAGVDNHLRYLDAQRRDFANRTALVEVNTQRQLAFAALYRAQGGGWQADDTE